MKRLKKWIRFGWIRAQCVMHDDRGISVIELILVLVVIIGLVLIFKSQLTSLVETIFEKITSESAGI
ncbi:MAG: Flp1 family type IVb pilin [Bariatricus sp.]|nr:Flp1 family type IVb pilin [Bariatricus sp.]